MKKILVKVISSGIWLQPILMIGMVKYLELNQPRLLMDKMNWFVMFMVSILPILYLSAENTGRPNSKEAITGKEAAKRPQVDKSLLYRKPEGIVFGKYKGLYVCRNLSLDGHVFLIGGSGSGKSSCLVIPSLLANPKANIFAVDIKGELSFKSTKYGGKHVLIFNPQDRNTCGYNAFYALSENSTSQQILEVMQNIAFSLISLPANVKDPFWKTSTRNLLIGLLIYYYKQGTVDFIGIIDEILGRPVKESIDAVMNNAKPKSVEYRYIVQFKDMEDETLGGIAAEMNNHIVIFANDQDIRYAFKDNGRKVNPTMLEKGSIYLSIREEKLTSYYDVMQLIINQTLAQLEKRPEDSKKQIIFVIDELPRILSAGKIDRLLDGARTLRSKKVCLFFITQSTEALMSAFTENEVADLISNCPYIVVLSASSTKTQKSVCSWCGKYKARKQSWSGSGKDRNVSVSYEEKDIVEPSDLLTLPNTGEAILISPYGYSRIKKVPYYEDKILKPMADEIIAYNKNIKQIERSSL